MPTASLLVRRGSQHSEPGLSDLKGFSLTPSFLPPSTAGNEQADSTGLKLCQLATWCLQLACWGSWPAAQQCFSDPGWAGK